MKIRVHLYVPKVAPNNIYKDNNINKYRKKKKRAFKETLNSQTLIF